MNENNVNNQKKGFISTSDLKKNDQKNGENLAQSFMEDEDDLIFMEKTNWEFINVLGRGSFGLVRSAINSQTHAKAAVKVCFCSIIHLFFKNFIILIILSKIYRESRKAMSGICQDWILRLTRCGNCITPTWLGCSRSWNVRIISIW